MAIPLPPDRPYAILGPHGQVLGYALPTVAQMEKAGSHFFYSSYHMAESRPDLDLSTIAPGACFAQWRVGVPCPNAWTGVIETLRPPASRVGVRVGYGKFCDVHMAGYQAMNPRGKGVTYLVWTRAEWEASDRQAVLDTAIDTESEPDIDSVEPGE